MTTKKTKAADMPGPIMYRTDLLRRAKRDTYLGFREIAGYTRLSVNTVTQAFDGNASKIETLWKLSQWFGIPWIALFDVDRKLKLDQCRGEGSVHGFYKIISGDLTGGE